ncbi:hypothetical protein XCR_0793 [Xanthomonas campestris pv. raphani 756C]|nr:hypothetical protein XCR_0793 [Xanthomonas campestris pv. raphani 756C]
MLALLHATTRCTSCCIAVSSLLSPRVCVIAFCLLLNVPQAFA